MRERQTERENEREKEREMRAMEIKWVRRL